MSAQIGIIGGSGLYDMAELTDREQVTITTPFGDPSGPYVLATLRGGRVAFLARHGAGHRLMPSELNFRANIYGFKTLGVERILSASAVGSLRQELPPQHIVIPDQFFDRTKGRVSTFFGRGHRGARRVRSSGLRRAARAWRTPRRRRRARTPTWAAPTCAWKGRSSPRWPSRSCTASWGMDVIGMTNLQEAKLAREAEICYATLALVTDYDCWHPEHDSVTVEMIVGNLLANARPRRRSSPRRSSGCPRGGRARARARWPPRSSRARTPSRSRPSGIWRRSSAIREVTAVAGGEWQWQPSRVTLATSH